MATFIEELAVRLSAEDSQFIKTIQTDLRTLERFASDYKKMGYTATQIENKLRPLRKNLLDSAVNAYKNELEAYKNKSHILTEEERQEREKAKLEKKREREKREAEKKAKQEAKEKAKQEKEQAKKLAEQHKKQVEGIRSIAMGFSKLRHAMVAMLPLFGAMGLTPLLNKTIGLSKALNTLNVSGVPFGLNTNVLGLGLASQAYGANAGSFLGWQQSIINRFTAKPDMLNIILQALRSGNRMARPMIMQEFGIPQDLWYFFDQLAEGKVDLKQYERYAQSVQKSIELWKPFQEELGKVNAVFTDIGNEISSVLMPQLMWVLEYTEKFGNWILENRENLKYLVYAFEALSVVTLLGGLKKLASVFKVLLSPIWNTIKNIIHLGTSLKKLKATFIDINGLLPQLKNYFRIVFLGHATLVKGLGAIVAVLAVIWAVITYIENIEEAQKANLEDDMKDGDPWGDASREYLAGKGGNSSVSQTNNVTINASDGNPAEIKKATLGALKGANDSLLEKIGINSPSSSYA